MFDFTAADQSSPGSFGSYDALITGHVREARARGGEPNKIAAIKALRASASIGLKEAKDAVEEYGLRHAIETLAPRSPLASTPASVILSFAVIALAGLVGLAIWLISG